MNCIILCRQYRPNYCPESGELYRYGHSKTIRQSVSDCRSDLGPDFGPRIGAVRLFELDKSTPKVGPTIFQSWADRIQSFSVLRLSINPCVNPVLSVHSFQSLLFTIQVHALAFFYNPFLSSVYPCFPFLSLHPFQNVLYYSSFSRPHQSFSIVRLSMLNYQFINLQSHLSFSIPTLLSKSILHVSMSNYQTFSILFLSMLIVSILKSCLSYSILIYFSSSLSYIYP